MPIVQASPEAPALGENPASNPRATIGDNFPPIEEQIAMEFREALLTDRPDFETRMDSAIEAVGRAAVTDDQTLGKAGDLDKILRACAAHIDDTHKAVKEPYLARGRACDAEKNARASRITTARFALRDKMNGFMAEREAKRRADEARIAAEQRAAAERAMAAEREREEAERKAAAAAAAAERAKQAGDEAAAAEARKAEEQAAQDAREAEARMEQDALAAAQAVPRNEPVRSDAGAAVSGRKVWQFQIVDVEVAFMAVSDDEKVREAIEKAIGRRVKAGTRKIEGVKIWETIQAIAR